ncbi:CBL-interacting protein kinase 6-like [Canna indica]|uniref:CBL-interacting protein kinase 6-like n=1 Tax=Canna indica TaxID=4628 RepID=A0AAQ3QQA5_9LILI|nr:CBL-interacting protein kinase 6-like [Canna indica]
MQGWVRMYKGALDSNIGNMNEGKVDLLDEMCMIEKVVAKEKVLRAGMAEQVKRDIVVMRLVRHPNNIELHEVMATHSRIFFAMEFVRGSELFACIASSGRLREDVVHRYFYQLVSIVDSKVEELAGGFCSEVVEFCSGL